MLFSKSIILTYNCTGECLHRFLLIFCLVDFINHSILLIFGSKNEHWMLPDDRRGYSAVDVLIWFCSHLGRGYWIFSGFHQCAKNGIFNEGPYSLGLWVSSTLLLTYLTAELYQETVWKRILLWVFLNVYKSRKEQYNNFNMPFFFHLFEFNHYYYLANLVSSIPLLTLPVLFLRQFQNSYFISKCFVIYFLKIRPLCSNKQYYQNWKALSI